MRIVANIPELAAIPQHKKLFVRELQEMAVREGFEPSVGFKAYGALAKLCFRPLSHLTLSRMKSAIRRLARQCRLS